MTATDWHAPDELLARFAADPATVDDALAASLEAHLVRCARCGTQLRAQTSPAFLNESWARIADEIDRPAVTWVERAVRGVGVPDGWARLVASSPGLRLAGALSVGAVCLLAVMSAWTSGGSGAFVLLAPLVPLAAVAASFHPAADPAGEAGIATPLHGWAVILRRTAVVGGAALLVLVAAGLVLGGAVGVPVGAWILPSLALAAGGIALGTWFRLEVAVGSLAFSWVVVVSAARWFDGAGTTVADSMVFAAPGRLCSVAVSVAAVAVIAARRDRFETMEVFA